MEKSILLYHFEDTILYSKLEKALSPLGVRLLRVEKENYHTPIGILTGVLKDSKEYEKDASGQPPDSPMLVFAGFDSKSLDRALALLRDSALTGLPYKAVMTQYNQYWDGCRLFREIKKEHEAMNPKICQ